MTTGKTPSVTEGAGGNGAELCCLGCPAMGAIFWRIVRRVPPAASPLLTLHRCVPQPPRARSVTPPAVAVVTGASRGFGRAVAIELAKSHGANITLMPVARNAALLGDTAAELTEVISLVSGS